MKGILLWLLAVVGGAAAGAAGGAAWLAYAAPEALEVSAPSEGGAPVDEASADEIAEAEMPLGETSEPSVPSVESVGDGVAGPALSGPDGSTGGGPAATSAPGTAVDASAPVATTEDAASEPFQPTESHQRLARIFAAMRPEEAAAVLGQLADDQARGVLLAMQPRNAAPILAELDPARAATLSRLVLGVRSP